MEVILPKDNSFTGAFFLGSFKDEAAVTRRSATVVLKRTYTIDTTTGSLVPTAGLRPLFMQDQPDNLVLNGDFEMSRNDYSEDPPNPQKAGRWSETANISSLAAAQGINNLMALEVSGPATERVGQTIVFEKPLGGRSFAFSFSAKSDAIPANVVAVQLETAGAGSICVVNASLSETNFNRFSAVGTWAAGLEATELKVVLPPADNPLRKVFYDRVQVEERNFATNWDAETVLRYDTRSGGL